MNYGAIKEGYLRVISATAAEDVAAVGAGRASLAGSSLSAGRTDDDVGAAIVGTVVEEDELALKVLLRLLHERLLVALLRLPDDLHVASLVDLNAPRRSILAHQRISQLSGRRQLHPTRLQIARAAHSVAFAARSSQLFRYLNQIKSCTTSVQPSVFIKSSIFFFL